MRNIKFYYCISFSLLLLSVSCKGKKQEPAVEFNKSAILTNIADNYIAPNYLNLKVKIDSLQLLWLNFKTTNSIQNFDEVKNAWKNSYLSFQKVKFIDFGPAESVALSGSLGTFPSDTAVIENNIASANYTLSSIGNVSAVGFSALDYLFFKANAYSEITAQNLRRTYISDLIQKMQDEVNFVNSNWPSYRSTFIDGSGTSSTSPFSLFVNAFCKDFEIMKNTKVGIPSGKQSLGIQRLDYLEAKYSKINTQLLKENLIALQSVYVGANGQGFDDYLIALDKNDLANNINARFSYMIDKVASWNTSLESKMTNSVQEVDDFYNYMQNTVVNLKTDMSSSFGIMITYQDNDGD